MSKIEWLTRTLDIVEARAENGRNEITIAANSEARDFVDLDLETLRLSNYMRNPVVMWAHQREQPPIARTLDIQRGEDGQLKASFEWLEGDRFAERIKNAWDKGFIRAASVSFGGGDATFLDNGKVRLTNAELFEWSLVPVPADPDALRLVERALDMPSGTMTGHVIDDETSTPKEDDDLRERVARLEEQIKLRDETPIPKAEQPYIEDELEEISRELEAFAASLRES